MIIHSSVPAVDRARFLFGEGGSWSADHSCLVRSRFLSLVLPGESVSPLKQQKIKFRRLAERDYITLCTPGRTLWLSRPSLTRLEIGYYWDAMWVI